MQVLKDPTDPSGTMYVKPTGAPKGLVIEQDITAALGKVHVVQGPLVPASLVGLTTLHIHAMAYIFYNACLAWKLPLGCVNSLSFFVSHTVGSEPVDIAKETP